MTTQVLGAYRTVKWKQIIDTDDIILFIKYIFLWSDNFQYRKLFL